MKPNANSIWTRLGVLGLVVLFLAVSVIAKIVLWEGLGFWDEGSILRSTIAGAGALGFAVAANWFLLKRRSQDAGDLRIVSVPARGDVKALAAGLLAGAAIFGAVYVSVLLTTELAGPSLQLEMPELVWLLGQTLVATALNASWEEFTFRGWPFAACVRAFWPYTTALALGGLFGLVHLSNPGWTPQAILSVAFAGWLLSFTMLFTRTIAAPIGLHIGWNFSQSLLTSPRIWAFESGGDTVLSGFGLEATTAGMTVTGLAAATAAFLFWRRNRRRLPGDRISDMMAS